MFHSQRIYPDNVDPQVGMRVSNKLLVFLSIKHTKKPLKTATKNNNNFRTRFFLLNQSFVTQDMTIQTVIYMSRNKNNMKVD